MLHARSKTVDRVDLESQRHRAQRDPVEQDAGQERPKPGPGGPGVWDRIENSRILLTSSLDPVLQA